MRKLRFLLPAVNAAGCLLFVLLREPSHGIIREGWETEHREPGITIMSGRFLLPSVACRPLHSWSEFHGGEALGVKVLEAVNVVPVVIAAEVDLLGRVGPAKRMPACAWSWVIAGLLFVCATVQWLAIGTIRDWLLARW